MTLKFNFVFQNQDGDNDEETEDHDAGDQAPDNLHETVEISIDGDETVEILTSDNSVGDSADHSAPNDVCSVETVTLGNSVGDDAVNNDEAVNNDNILMPTENNAESTNLRDQNFKTFSVVDGTLNFG